MLMTAGGAPEQRLAELRQAGVKLSIDGSPQGKTAWLTEPYLVPPHGQKKGYRGYGVMPDAKANEYVARAVSNGWQILVHGNGDAAIDQMIGAVRASGSVEKARAVRPCDLLDGRVHLRRAALVWSPVARRPEPAGQNLRL